MVNCEKSTKYLVGVCWQPNSCRPVLVASWQANRMAAGRVEFSSCIQEGDGNRLCTPHQITTLRQPSKYHYVIVPAGSSMPMV